MGDGRIFLKTGRDASFKKDISNEPNFDGIHLAGGPLKHRKCDRKACNCCALEHKYRVVPSRHKGAHAHSADRRDKDQCQSEIFQGMFYWIQKFSYFKLLFSE